MTTSYTNIFNDHLILPSQNPYIAIRLANDPTFLAWSNNFGDNSLVVSNIMDVTPTGNFQSLILPDATQTSIGTSFCINNPTLISFSLYSNDEITVISEIDQSFLTFYLTSNTNSDGSPNPNGSWQRVKAFGNAAVSSIELVSDNDNIKVSATPSNPITSAGTFTLSLANELEQLTSFGHQLGFVAHVADTADPDLPTKFRVRTLIGAPGNINITHPNGVNGDPVFTISSDLTINRLRVGNLTLEQSTISAALGTMLLQTNGFPGGITLQTNQDAGAINLNAGTNGLVSCSGRLAIGNGNSLILSDSPSLSPNSIAIKASNVASNYGMVLPSTIPTPGQVLRVNTVAVGPNAVLEWSNAPAGPALPTFPGSIPIYTDTAGSLGDSVVALRTTPIGGSTVALLLNNIGNVKSIGVGNLFIGGTADDNLITSLAGGVDIIPLTNNNLFLGAQGTGIIQILSNTLSFDVNNILTISNAVAAPTGTAGKLNISSHDAAGISVLSLTSANSPVIAGAPPPADMRVQIMVNGTAYWLHGSTT